VWRIDSPEDPTAAGVELTFDAAPSASTMQTHTIGETTYRYTGIATNDGQGYDCLGADGVLVLLETAASITDGAAAIEIGFLN